MTPILTLQQIRDHSPCREGWTKLLKTLATDDMSTVVTIGQIARSNGPQDALWCLRCTDFDRRDAVRCIMPSVRRASVHSTDQRITDCIAAIDQWLAGDDTVDLIYAAADAARAAADAAAYAAYAAANAAYAAARAAARATAYAAADAAAYAADAPAYAAGAAYATAYATAYAPAYAAGAAAYAAYAARAARAAEIEQQVQDICEVFP